MSNLNKVILMGNLTRDPELRYTAKGTTICRIGMATNRRWKTESGEPREETTFVDVDAFGRAAETMGQYLKKGRSLVVEGRLKLDQWEDKQTGQKRSKLGVVCEQFHFIGGRDDAPPPPNSQLPSPAQAAPAPASPISDDDVPF